MLVDIYMCQQMSEPRDPDDVMRNLHVYVYYPLLLFIDSFFKQRVGLEAARIRGINEPMKVELFQSSGKVECFTASVIVTRP